MTATTIRRLVWNDQDGRQLDFELHGSLTQTSTPVLFLPGLDLAPDWAFYPYLIGKIAEQRPVLIATRREGGKISEELAAAEALVDAVARGGLPESAQWRRGKLGLVAHGKGSGLAVLLAAGQPAIGAVLAISPMCTFNRESGDPESRVRADIAQHGVRFQLELAARQVACKIVLVHGEEDDVAPFAEGEVLYHWLPKDKSSLVLLEKTGHSLGAQHPFDGTNKELDRVVRIARELFTRELEPPTAAL